MNDGLNSRAELLGYEMRISISTQQRDLEKEHAGGPNAWSAAEPWQDVFSDERLNLKEKKRAEKNREGVGKGQA